MTGDDVRGAGFGTRLSADKPKTEERGRSVSGAEGKSQ